ncbi:MAG: DUF6263 family protein [Balneolales bacterium]|nr:DUF6263 family protein [Balneolales bacterium]
MRIKSLLPALLCLLSGTVSAFQNSYTLTVGDNYVLETNQKLTQSLMMMGQSQDIETNTVTIETIEVISFEEGVYTLKNTISSIRAEVTTLMGSQTVSSEDPASDGGILSTLVDKPYTFKMDRYGQILEINDLEELQSAIQQVLSGNPGATQIVNAFSEESLKANLNLRFSVYSNSGQKEWVSEKKLEIAGVPTNFSSNYKNGHEGSAEVNSTLSIKTSTVQMGMQVELDLSGSQKTTFTLDNASGIPISINTTGTLDGVSMTMGNNIPTGVLTESTTTITKQ